MTLIWFLVAMPILALACAAYVDAKDQRTGMPPPVSPLPLPPPRPQIVIASFPYLQPRREIKWISRTECQSLLRTSEDVIFIHLTRRPRNRFMALGAPSDLFISPDDIGAILRWLPSESSAVLYGEVDICNSVLTAVRDMPGQAPLYVLEETPFPSELASGAA